MEHVKAEHNSCVITEADGNLWTALGKLSCRIRRPLDRLSRHSRGCILIYRLYITWLQTGNACGVSGFGAYLALFFFSGNKAESGYICIHPTNMLQKYIITKIEGSIAHTAEDFSDVLLLLPLSPFCLSLCHWKKVSFQYSLSVSTVTLCKFSQYKHYQQLFLKRNTSTVKKMNAQGFGLFLLHQLMLRLAVDSNKNHSVKCHWNALNQI